MFWGEFTPQPFSQHTLSCLWGSSGMAVTHTCFLYSSEQGALARPEVYFVFLLTKVT